MVVPKSYIAIFSTEIVKKHAAMMMLKLKILTFKLQ